MAVISLNSSDAIKRNWPLPTEKVAELLADGTLRSIVQATLTPSVLGRTYKGKANMRRVYVFGPDDLEEMIVGEETPWEEVDELPANALYTVTGILAQAEPRILQTLMAQNGGVMPAILPPQTEE